MIVVLVLVYGLIEEVGMVEAHKEKNVFEGGSHKKNANDKRSGSSGLGGSLLTYKRRKNVGVVEQGMVWDNQETHLVEKYIKKSFDQASQERSHALTFTSRYCLLKHQRDIVLEQMCRLLETEGGLRKCIQDALAFHSGSGIKTTAANESVHSCEAGTIFDIIMSDKFVQLCSLLLENGMKADKLFDLSHINSRMKEKAYESSPMLFHSDIQQVWTKLQKLGNDIVALAKCLSDKTMTSFREQVDELACICTTKGIESAHENCIVCERLNNAFRSPFDGRGEKELSANEEVKNCCIDRDDDDDKIVLCDCCDHAYHIYCMQPPCAAIPGGNWFCTKCDAGIQRVRKANSWYENMQYRKRTLDEKLETEEAALNKCGGD